MTANLSGVTTANDTSNSPGVEMGDMFCDAALAALCLKVTTKRWWTFTGLGDVQVLLFTFLNWPRIHPKSVWHLSRTCPSPPTGKTKVG